MKHLKIAAYCILIIGLIAACSLFGNGADTCVSAFKSAVTSGNWSGFYTYLDPNASMYNEAKASSYWIIPFPTGETYAVNISVSGSTASGKISSTYKYNNSSITISMTADVMGGYTISSITLDGTSIFY